MLTVVKTVAVLEQTESVLEMETWITAKKDIAIMEVGISVPQKMPAGKEKIIIVGTPLEAILGKKERALEKYADPIAYVTNPTRASLLIISPSHP